MTPQSMLEALARVRERREDSTRRELEAATRAVHAALAVLQARRQAQQAVEDDIALTLRRPYEQGGRGGAQMLDVQRGLRRVELLREHLAQAQDKVRRAQDDLAARQQARAQALQAHLRARHQHEAVRDQLARGALDIARVAERRLTDATLDLLGARAHRSAID